MNFTFKKIPPEWKYILFLFFFSRLLLTLIGVISRLFITQYIRGVIETPFFNAPVFLDIWGVWDSWWYVEIAQYGYSAVVQSPLIQNVCCGQNNYGFFPFYPLLIHGLGFFIHDYFISGIIISNIALLLSAYVLYKLVLLDFNKEIAKGSVLFLFMLPTSFILSGVFSESLFLFFSLLAFYFARQKRWLYVGIVGYLISLTRPTGFLLVLPLLYIFLRYEFLDSNFKLLIRKKKLKVTNIATKVFAISTPVLGMVTFMFYTLYKTGDFLKYFHVKQVSWFVYLADPFYVFFSFFLSKSFYFISVGIYTAILLMILFWVRKRVPFEYLFYTVLLIVFSMMNGVEATFSMPRFSSEFFILPLALVLLKTKKGYDVSNVLIAVQTVFMVLWVQGILIL